MHPATASPNSPIFDLERGAAFAASSRDGAGRSLDGVESTLYVRDNAASRAISSVSASDIYMSSNGSGQRFVQFGVIQGHFQTSACAGGGSPEDYQMTHPHLFVGFGSRSPSACETLLDLGQFEVLGYRHFGLRRNSDGNYYARLDSTVEWVSTMTPAFPSAMQPAVNAEADDNCTFMYARANEGSAPYETLQHHALGASWAYWATKTVLPNVTNPISYYEQTSPDPGSAREFLFYGPNTLPSNC